MSNLQITADRIKLLCDKVGISVNKMLVDSTAGARTYHNILAGSHPSSDKLAKIADYFNVSTDYLLGLTDDPRTLSQILATQNELVRDVAELDENDIAVAKRIIKGLKSKEEFAEELGAFGKKPLIE